MRALAEREANPKIVVNIECVRYMSSAALGELVSANRQIARSDGRLCLAGPTPEVSEILHITRLGKVIPIYDDLAAARQSFE